MKTPRSLNKHRFRPCVERLEVRDTPTLSVSGGFGAPLLIQAVGSTQLNQNHTVTILDDGKGDITLIADGFTGTFTGITAITFFGGNKKDTLTYILTGNLQQTESLAFHLRQGNDTFAGILQGDIGNTSGGTTTNGILNLNIDHGPGNDTSTLQVLGNVLAGSQLTDAENFGGNATGTANTVTSTVIVQGNVLGNANFSFQTGGSTSFANKETLNFIQVGNVRGAETVTAQGTTESPGFIHDTYLFTGQLTGTLTVTEDAGSSSTNRATNTLNEQFTLDSGSSGTLTAVENNQPKSKGTEVLDVFKLPPVTTTVTGIIDQAIGSTAVTNDPAEVTIIPTP
jgi:hypothetical protein